MRILSEQTGLSVSEMLFFEDQLRDVKNEPPDTMTMLWLLAPYATSCPTIHRVSEPISFATQVHEVRTLGVTSVHCPRGLTHDAFDKGLQQYRCRGHA